MIRKAAPQDAPTLAALAIQMWEDNDPAELTEEFGVLLGSESAACFLWETGGRAGAFAQCQLRRDYVEGTETSPVGYLEGIFVEPQYRRRGIARQLLAACEAWAKAEGCREFASDCELDNLESLRFHLSVGFLEANRIICFQKNL